MTLDQLTTAFQALGVVSLLVFAVYGGSRDKDKAWRVFGLQYRQGVKDLIADRDEWKELALRAMNVCCGARNAA